jgi:hypothetical protein
MIADEQKPLALVTAQSAAPTLAGTKSLAARGRNDLRIKEEADEWHRKGLKAIKDTVSMTVSPPPNSSIPDFQRTLDYGKLIQAGQDPNLVAKSLGMSPEDEEMARTFHCFLPSILVLESERMQQEEEQRQTELKKYEDALREAFQCFEKGIRLNPDHPELQFCIGTSYNQGFGVPQDGALGFNWIRKAAEQGHDRAQFNLCTFYFRGEGVPQDNLQAAAWCLKAAEQGHHEAQLLLSKLYLSGEGVPKDDLEACFWHELSISQWNNAVAMKVEKEFPAELSSNEIASLEQRLPARA